MPFDQSSQFAVIVINQQYLIADECFSFDFFFPCFSFDSVEMAKSKNFDKTVTFHNK